MQTPDEEDDQDKREVQRQNHILNAIGGGPIRHAELGTYAVDEMRSNTTATFRPTTIEKDIHDKIGHPDHQGKDSQRILEYEQQARGAELRLWTPPVLRGAYDFGFRIRGLSIMHFLGPSRSALMKGEVPSPATKDPSYENLKEALRNLRQFGGGFYNESTVDFIRAIERFVESFGNTGVPDGGATKCLVFWIDAKLCQFRGLVLAEGLISAMRIKDELSLHDPLLAELLYDEQKTMIATLKAQLEVKPTSNAQLLRQSRNASSETRGIPKDVVRLMPKQGALNLCMKYLSKEGCSGSSDRTSGKCFSTKRAHFRPKTLPEPVKQHIIKNFGGLAPEFADL
ncbi:hypothetical protein PInf_004866 [Phytophthora infestans]|nr:hypothetical protein PInf_004866 [Phytophthora infestans]